MNLDIDGLVVPLLKLAVDLAARFEARLIGFSAADARLPIVGPEGGAVAAEVWAQEREDIDRRLKQLYADLTAWRRVPPMWNGDKWPAIRPARWPKRRDFLIVTAARNGASTGDAYRFADPGSLVLQAGRPVLVTADGAAHLPAKKVVIAWKDAREARRAVADAVPLLLSADEVTVVTVDREAREDWAGVADVAAFLLRHGIKARTEVVTAKDEVARLGEFITALGLSGCFRRLRS